MKYDLTEFEEIEMDLIEDMIDKMRGSEDVICFNDKNEISRLVKGFVELKEDVEYWKGSYKKEMKKRYIDPIDEKIKKAEEDLELLKQSMLLSLDEIGESKITFPGIGRINKRSVPEKIEYPENEKDFALSIYEDNPQSKFIKLVPVLDKKAIMEDFKETGDLPFSELSIIGKSQSVTVTPEKKEEE